MTDRELLEMAAKAAGIELGRWDGTSFMRKDSMYSWNPLIDDGDALRLAISLRLVIHIWDDLSDISVAKTLPGGDDPDPTSNDWLSEDTHSHNGYPYAATRRAIVRAAAEIGRGME